jgi:hypothetical protein
LQHSHRFRSANSAAIVPVVSKKPGTFASPPAEDLTTFRDASRTGKHALVSCQLGAQSSAMPENKDHQIEKDRENPNTTQYTKDHYLSSPARTQFASAAHERQFWGIAALQAEIGSYSLRPATGPWPVQ